jgi:hypothetical protein
LSRMFLELPCGAEKKEMPLRRNEYVQAMRWCI